MSVHTGSNSITLRKTIVQTYKNSVDTPDTDPTCLDVDDDTHWKITLKYSVNRQENNTSILSIQT